MPKTLKPAQVFRLGRIRASIWSNQTPKGDLWFNVKIVRSYQEAGEWKESDSFSRDDLPAVAKAADMAYSWIWRRQMKADKPAGESHDAA